MNLLGETKLKKLSQLILSFSKADQTEVSIYTFDHALTRFANSFIHQNVRYENILVKVRTVISKRIGVASINSIEVSDLHEVVRRAVKIARLSREDPDFISLPKASLIRKISSFFQSTINFGSIDRAKAVKTVIETAKRSKLTASGAYEIIISELSIANNLGVWAYQPTTSASFSTVVSGENSSGFALELNFDARKIHPEEVAKRAVDKAKMGEDPIAILPGEYDVILEPPAVAEMMDFFSYLGPNARVFYEQASYLRDKLGKRVFSPKLTIFDDPLDERGMPMAFDYEGVPKQKTILIEKGVAKTIVYDSYYANKYKKKNTGHALPAPNTEGPMPGHLVFTPGKKTTQELIKTVKKGILVSRFWYVRMLHHYQMNITGMTRDGTFLIEEGKITSSLKNLRFTQSIPEVLKNIEGISKDLTLRPSWVGAGLFPTIFVRKFHFTSTTEF